jgi:hypothetical protein
MNKRMTILAAICFALSVAPTTVSLAQDDMDDGGERCIDTRRISRTEIVDAENILFYMRGGVIYRNTLSHKCTALAREKRFSYKTTISRLCDIDVITVLYSMGSGLTSGPSCGLGKFYPVSKEEAEALRQGPDADIEPEPIKPSDPEQPEIATPGEDS